VIGKVCKIQVLSEKYLVALSVRGSERVDPVYGYFEITFLSEMTVEFYAECSRVLDLCLSLVSIYH